jgi:hypothetical protein
MFKPWLLKLIPGLLLILLAGTVLAGGVVVTLDESIGDATTGKAFDVNFTLRSMHDGSLQDGWHPIILATHPSTGETLRFDAATLGEAGRYSASLTLPVAGEWTWRIVPEADYPAELISEMTPITVLPAAAPAVQSAPATVPAAAWVAAALVSVAGLGLVLARLRRRAVAMF